LDELPPEHPAGGKLTVVGFSHGDGRANLAARTADEVRSCFIASV
jgi:hypothetical protein